MIKSSLQNCFLDKVNFTMPHGEKQKLCQTKQSASKN